MDNVLTVAVFVVPFLVGGSLLWWLQKHHPTREEWRESVNACETDMNNLGGKLNQIREEVQSNRDRVKDALAAADNSSRELSRMHEHIEKNLIGPIRELTGKMEGLQLEFAKQTATAQYVERTISEIKHWIEADHRSDRHHP